MLTYVTGNYGKYVSVKERFEKKGIKIEYFTCDLEEPDINDISVISKAKAAFAYRKLNSPVFVMDSGFYIEAYPNLPGYPGAFVKRSGVSSNIRGLLETMKDVQNRNCCFLDCLTYYDGINYYQFFGESKGTLATTIKGSDKDKALSNLWKVFMPEGYSKTLAEMSDEELSERRKNRVGATDKFIEWYKENIIGNRIVLIENK